MASLLHPAPLPLRLSVIAGAKPRRGRRKKPTISTGITAIKRALSLAATLQRPLDQILLGGGGGGGPTGLGGNGSGWWFERRGRPSGKTWMRLLAGLAAAAAAIAVDGKRDGGKMKSRVLMAASLGFRVSASKGGIAAVFLIVLLIGFTMLRDGKVCCS